MQHNYDCEVYTLADVLNDLLRYEETIDDYDTRKHVAILLDDLIAAVADVNATIGDLTEEARTQAWEAERLQDELYYANSELDDLREEIKDFKDSLRKFVE